MIIGCTGASFKPDIAMPAPFLKGDETTLSPFQKDNSILITSF